MSKQSGRVGEVTGKVAPTQSHDPQFISEDGTKLLGLDGFALIRVQLEPDGARVVHVVTADETVAACPSCGVIAIARKSSATTHPRDVPYGADPAQLVWHESRGRCRESICERGSLV